MEIDAVPAYAHPADDPARIPNNKGEVWDILHHHCPGADKGVLSDRHPTYDGAVGAKACTPSNQCRKKFFHAPDLATGIDHVRKHHRRTTEDKVLKCHAFVHGDIILDLDPLTDDYVWADHHVLTDPAILPDPRIPQNVGEMPDGCSFTDLNALVDACRLMRKVGSRTVWSGLVYRRINALEALLARAKNGQHPERLIAIGPRRGAPLDALYEMGTFGPQGFYPIERNSLGLSSICDGDVVSPVDGMRIEQQLVLLFHIVEQRHLSAPNDDKFLLLERMQP